ncbi:MAG: hypothetical protein AAFY31_01075 [Pseudomonadota bacterium]
MKRAILWVVGIVVGVPLAIVTLIAFMLFVFYPLQHAWNVRAADSRNANVWDESTARVVTVEVTVHSEVGPETLQTDVVCHRGHFARPWTLKSGAPATGVAPRSIGSEALEADFPTGAQLFVELRFLCHRVFREEVLDPPWQLKNSQMYVFSSQDSLYCSFSDIGRGGNYVLQTDAARVEHPIIVAISEKPLASVATLADLGTSETPSTSAEFARTWGREMRRSNWHKEKACWTGRAGVCSDVMTRACGANPR